MKSISSIPLLVTIALVIVLSWTLVGISVPPAAAQGVQFWNKPCKKAFKQWQNAEKHKAFATSNPDANRGGQACGSAWGHASKSAAEKAAITFCRKGNYGTCWVIRSE